MVAFLGGSRGTGPADCARWGRRQFVPIRKFPIKNLMHPHHRCVGSREHEEVQIEG